ncbi:hypothetical protein ACP26L_17325 [Paenibacillus sp. S-38]
MFYVLLPVLFFLKLHWYIGLGMYFTGYTMVSVIITKAHVK